MGKIQEIKFNSQKWVNIENPTKEDMNKIREEYKFHPLDMEDVIYPTQRSKIDKYRNYFFLILMFPVYNRETKEIDPTEVDFFVSKDFVVTIHHGNLPPIIDLFQICQSNDSARENTFGGSTDMLLYNILKKLHLYIYPMLDHVSLDIADIKTHIFTGKEKEMVKQILEIRRNITDFRKIMDAHEATISRLLKKGTGVYHVDEKYQDYFDDLIDYTKEIWDQLGTFKEAIEALHETNESLISFRLNDVMKILTIFSVVLLPATVITSLFGVNAKSMPLASHPNGFWAIFGITMLASAMTLIYIWKKHWTK
ncbi:magnesium transporter CorA family protein [Patescibacteria group bacterium]|nr:magnesium transporter CorA family protein [Patescibacteria group bacterium]MBU1673926.1 magnesium transporter CorA family protein [Patescibacteria group bacterium]MBU1963920.1 magnesium transporter CorA family protein [Patescibacteria group bacterium]